ncbi:adenylate/guanylate cyclase domain-containing protein [Phytohabitans sp. ZYX-F-186]|uniref:Adenylate/guanylate cyclase domain-containing protein n=1 Tax=Phytohabitans maris TaxID=3071409 RepID=A0ABU0Z9Q4_9ACTN|nr:adenylate/guanylate cyclase domain-containing protein [Phytohabitans sp. ZYX-F-186]MDQ7903065.1 adenylate/guanylate cyclase domain-containing protein [Phytohabitans sp. ZYX-F-186]
MELVKSTGTDYDHVASYGRIKEILDGADVNYEEVDSLPSRDRLTFKNGYYANCSAMFVDIRKSSKLPEKYKRPRLAKLYRAYISEIVAVMDGNPKCQEVNIVGDGVWGVFDTPYKPDIDTTFRAAYSANSAIKMLNYQLKKHDYEPISVGIGLSYGRALVIKAGFSGSGINEVVYMGDVVNQAAKLAAHGSEMWNDRPIMVSDVFYGNLKDDNKALLSWNANRQAWHGDVINKGMDDWYQENCV